MTNKNTGLVYCVECMSLKCNEALALRTGFVIVDTNTGEPDPDGVRVNAGLHMESARIAAEGLKAEAQALI